ncbi:MAG TPA: guanylate kinase [Gammaproteobacteria bacterium]|nr:guanylate kinase [Gammaproteobacteria bacterium]
MPGNLFIVSAPSGAGKTTLVNALIQRLGSAFGLERVITYTSRDPRPGDLHGVDYHFMSSKEFEAKMAGGFFMEWSGAYGNYYGSPKSIVSDLDQGRSFIMILDRAGAQAVQRVVPSATLIWIVPPSLYILRQRLEARGADSSESIERRLKLASHELEDERNNPRYAHHILNENLPEAVEKLEQIVAAALSREGGVKQPETTI